MIREYIYGGAAVEEQERQTHRTRWPWLLLIGLQAEEVKAAEAADFGDFSVDPESAVSFENGVLTITGDAKVSMADGKDATTMRIVIADDAEVTMDGLTINAAGGPAKLTHILCNAFGFGGNDSSLLISR